MLSIDEAIAHAKEVANEQRELFRLCPYPSQECNGADICKCLKNKHDGCIKCAEEHEQLAEWLEELKELRLQNHLGRDEALIAGRKEGYKKAVDDFVNACKENTICKTFGLRECGIEQIAEQLKAGGENE